MSRVVMTRALPTFRSYLVCTSHWWSRSHTRLVPSENTTSRQSRPVMTSVASMTAVGRPRSSKTRSPIWSCSMSFQPVGVGIGVSRASAFPSIRATMSSGSSTHSSVRPRTNSPGWMTNGSPSPTTTSSVRFRGGSRRSIAVVRWLWKTRKESPRRRSTDAGWTRSASHGSILIRPSSTRRRIAPSESTETGPGPGTAPSVPGSADLGCCPGWRTTTTGWASRPRGATRATARSPTSGAASGRRSPPPASSAWGGSRRSCSCCWPPRGPRGRRGGGPRCGRAAGRPARSRRAARAAACAGAAAPGAAACGRCRRRRARPRRDRAPAGSPTTPARSRRRAGSSTPGTGRASPSPSRGMLPAGGRPMRRESAQRDRGVVERRAAVQLRDAGRDLLAAQGQHPLGPEGLDVERGQYGPVGHRPPQQRLVDLLVRVRGEVAHEAARERVAGARGVDDVGRRIGRQREVAVAREEGGAVLALLGDDDARAEVEHGARGAYEVRLVRELLELAVVEDHAVDEPDRAHERLVGDVDPQVHRVHPHEPRRRALLAHTALEVGLDVREEDDVRARRGLRQRGLEVLEDVEVGLERVADVDVALVAPGPEERLAAGDVLDVVRDDPARVQRGVLHLAEVVAHGADDARLVEERRGEREVHRRAAQQPVAPAGLGLDGVEGDGPDDRERHAAGDGSVRSACARSGSPPSAALRCSSWSRTPPSPSPARARCWYA